MSLSGNGWYRAGVGVAWATAFLLILIEAFAGLWLLSAWLFRKAARA